ncbi:TrbI/VirB10 family protein [Vibrio campbellii]|uniref:TrbI/VirB10 family protein n=1 Tax=Vibrio campbellii TaxID=680 RepID=UPI000CD3652C|nr:TrbI/VirB10 family protein [Vibrio campbellii]AUW07641.1 conjugal transfer protein [Vibrio campbellii]
MSEHQETSPRFDKKFKLYVAGTFGAISLLFLVLFLTEKMRAKPQPETASTAAPVTESNQPTDLTARTFESVRDERQHADDTFVAAKQDKVPDQATPEPVKVVPEGVAREKAQQEALEYKRAALAARSIWGLEAAMPTPQHSANPAPSTSPSLLPDEQLSSDAQRQMIAKRLQEMAILKQQIQSGNYNAIEVGNKTQTLTSIEHSFSPPPPTIVGFTEENQYNASTEGLLKLPIGTIIPAITMTKANSDNTGTFKALVSQDIFDTTNEYVLIPKGAEVILKSVKVSGTNEAINYRIGVTVPWIVLPNGNKVDLSKSTGLDREGLAGMSDQVDRHLLAQFMGVAAYALVANETSYEGTGANSDASYVGEFSKGVREQLSPLAQKYLALTPTITIRSGQSMNVIVEEEIYLTPWRHIYEDYL